jgi:hypothetical protein
MTALRGRHLINVYYSIAVWYLGILVSVYLQNPGPLALYGRTIVMPRQPSHDPLQLPDSGDRVPTC